MPIWKQLGHQQLLQTPRLKCRRRSTDKSKAEFCILGPFFQFKPWTFCQISNIILSLQPSSQFIAEHLMTGLSCAHVCARGTHNGWRSLRHGMSSIYRILIKNTFYLSYLINWLEITQLTTLNLKALRCRSSSGRKGNKDTHTHTHTSREPKKSSTCPKGTRHKSLQLNKAEKAQEQESPSLPTVQSKCYFCHDNDFIYI